MNSAVVFLLFTTCKIFKFNLIFIKLLYACFNMVYLCNLEIIEKKSICYFKIKCHSYMVFRKNQIKYVVQNKYYFHLIVIRFQVELINLSNII